MIAPQSARMIVSNKAGRAGSEMEVIEHAAAHQQDAGEDDQQAAAAAPRPGAVRPARAHLPSARRIMHSQKTGACRGSKSAKAIKKSPTWSASDSWPRS